MKTRARRGTENVAAICDLGEESFIEMAEYHGGGGGSAVDDTLGGACVTDDRAAASLDARCIARAKVATLFFKRSFLAPSFNLH